MLVEMKILLISRLLWLCGPNFLCNIFSLHPESSVPTLNDLVPEERCCIQSTIAVNHLPNSNDLFHKNSSLSKLKRVTAYCLRYYEGGLRHANIAYGHKRPILLSKGHILTDLIVRQYHEILLHTNPQFVQSSIQEQYWIIGARDTSRHLIRKCMKCSRIRASITNQMMGDLPATRISPHSYVVE
ncbi:reverse transcriptase [Caerostris darwini]|uniref:Reverse transcriptase n=1 Tax=Caerostris darwini TaxID=1538125 RepID=A0AAV4V0E5_9ARAC|nr:reverse transcriptase [Caerostris darwini]